MTASPITPQEYLIIMQSARQVQWSAELSLSMLFWAQEYPLMRLPLLALHKVLTAYARWHYCRANRIYAKAIAND